MRSEKNMYGLPRSTDLKTRPILKWAGGKQQLLTHLLDKVPDVYNKYIEPFVGGGALFFALHPDKAIISDANPELINLYKVLAKDVEPLLDALQVFKTDKDSYYKIRALDAAHLSDIEKAARTIFLNRTCFNGL